MLRPVDGSLSPKETTAGSNPARSANKYIMRWHEITNEITIKLGGMTPSADSPAQKFLDELDSITQESPFNHRQRILGSAKVEVRGLGNTTVRLSDIQGSGSGSGTQALRVLCDLADKYDVTIKLTADGYADTSTDVLVAWYKKHGFHEMDEVDGAVDMMRDPK